MGKRLNYIDNLRSITVFLLVLYHIALAYNSWGEANYIFFERVNPIASIVVFISPWFMPLMFLLAGVSASFSMKKRGVTAFIKERLKRLGIPLIVGIIFINPILSYVADKSHNGYEGNYFEHLKLVFNFKIYMRQVRREDVVKWMLNSKNNLRLRHVKSEWELLRECTPPSRDIPAVRFR